MLDPCGFLVIDKPAGLTSHDCVARARRAYGLRRVGHGGTLDPAVTGVLPMALGPATRLLPYLSGDKTYRGVIQLGLRTSSDDLDGEPLERHPIPGLDPAHLEAALAAFRGPIQQVPPQVSAVHVNGERAHVRARRGEASALEARPVRIDQLDLLAWHPDRGQLELLVRCSAGTYIRSLARDLGERLGCGGCLAHLRRTAALGFGLHQAVPLSVLEGPPPPLIDPVLVLAHLPQRPLALHEQQGWRCGRPLAAVGGTMVPPTNQPVAVLNPDGRLAGIALAGDDGRLQPKLVFDAAG
ncbi:MAG: tRNA pseudouridine(55) synthase TruB [Cyanobacteriota bacterium]|nr:tRNA pseudouridine(55) synthase TruB [Cyanobacteriota bacterium]